jgi:hypothetical protein
MVVLHRLLTAYVFWGDLFANGIWASRKPGANVSVALLIANGWRPDGVARGRHRHAVAVPGGNYGSGYGPILLPVERSFSLQSGIHSKVTESAGARDGASADVCTLHSQASGA